MDRESLNILSNNIGKLREAFPESFTEGKIDWEKLQATLGKENIEFRNERYVLNWAGKTEAFRILQQPTTGTLKPVPEESVEFESTENVFIEGENLEVLKILQKSYYGKIKCIIIDPPYNTGNDSFIYPDSFKESKEEYLKRIGEKDEEGYLLREGFFRKNSKENGHYHSNWLSMMYPRLFLAKNLLREDGVIFVHIDDNEFHNLRLIMNEILGEENFIATIIWQKKYSPQNDAKYFSDSHEYLLVYTKRINEFKIGLLNRTEAANARYKNPDNDPRGPWKPSDLTRQEYRPNDDYEIISPKSKKTFKPPKGNSWGRPKDMIEELIKDNRIWFGPDGNSIPQLKRFLSEVKDGITPQTLWLRDEVGDSQEGKKLIKGILENVSIFETPKPVRIIKKCLRVANVSKDNSDLVLDFFAGSGTTAQAVLELNKEDGGNRKFILVQLPEKCDAQSEAYKAGFKTIAEISKERIKRVIKKLKVEAEVAEKKKAGELKLETGITPITFDRGFKVFKFSSSNFKIWRGADITEENLEAQLDAFTNPVSEGSENDNMLYELILKAGYLLTDKIQKHGDFYSIAGGELIIAIERMDQSLAESIILAKPQKVITLDRLFTGNDQLKTNTVLQMKDAEIDFKTI